MITIKPAEILGLNAGCLEKGRNADVVVVDLSRPNLIPTRLDNVLENLVWAANGSEIRYVIANGRILVEDYKIRVPSSPVILASLQQLSEIFVSHKSQTKVVRETGVAR